jgi:hypothetical protein
VALPLRPGVVLRRARVRAPAWTSVARNALPLAVVAVYAAAVARLLPYELLQDGWLTLVAGREIVEHGLPTTNELTIWANGVDWVDQQWFAQLCFYGLAAFGGVKLALLAHGTVLVGTLALAFVAARRLGATAPNVALAGALLMFVAPWTLQLRAQTLALPLFVGVLWLLASDSRSPSRRVYFALPLLVLWANVHGTVVMAAGLVTLRGIQRRSPLLALAPIASVFASPYALDLPGYYQTMLFDSTLRTFVVEWRPSTPSITTALFYLAAFASTALLARNRRALTGFESVALMLTLAAALPAIRSIAWFGLTAMILAPRLLDAELGRTESRPPRIALPIGAVAATVVLLVAAGAATRPGAWFTQSWQAEAADHAARGSHVLADERFANWLLWERPDLRGRLAFDSRYELLAHSDLERLVDYNSRGEGWRRATRGYDVLVIDAKRQRAKLAALAGDGYSVSYRNDLVAVLRRTP